MKKNISTINVKNKKASYNYEFLEEFVAGVSLLGSEVKSIRNGNVSIGESHCIINNKEVFVVGMHIAEYKRSNHDPYRKRKLLLTKKQINKLDDKLKTKGNTIVPVSLFENDKGLLKMKIALSRGKKSYDKKQAIKENDIKRDMQREIKM